MKTFALPDFTPAENTAWLLAIDALRAFQVPA